MASTCPFLTLTPVIRKEIYKYILLTSRSTHQLTRKSEAGSGDAYIQGNGREQRGFPAASHSGADLRSAGNL